MIEPEALSLRARTGPTWALGAQAARTCEEAGRVIKYVPGARAPRCGAMLACMGELPSQRAGSLRLAANFYAGVAGVWRAHLGRGEALRHLVDHTPPEWPGPLGWPMSQLQTRHGRPRRLHPPS